VRESLVHRLGAELLGTFGFFFLGFMGIAAAIDQSGSIGNGGIAAGFGLGLTMMLFAFGHISGGHFNPAVTLGLVCGRRFPVRELPAYWGVQLIGGLAAAGAVRVLFDGGVGGGLVTVPATGVSGGTAVVLEAVCSFLFLLVIIAVATDERAAWHGMFAPVAIGGFIFTAATVVGPFTGGSFNPARSLAPAVVAGSFSNLWVYLVGPFLGAVAGGIVYLYLRQSGTAAEVEEEPLTDRGAR
jgi:MIP family channel proteins